MSKSKSFCFICGVVKSRKDEIISYHRFPKERRELQEWLNCFKLNSASAKDKFDYRRLCSRHFATTDFYESGGRRQLKWNAVPSIKFVDRIEYHRKHLRTQTADDFDLKNNIDAVNVDNAENPKQIKNRSKKCIICGPLENHLPLFTFPKGERGKVWMEFCGVQSVTNNNRVCSRHFEAEYFSRPPGQSERSTLRNNAVPTLSISSEEVDPLKLLEASLYVIDNVTVGFNYLHTEYATENTTSVVETACPSVDRTNFSSDDETNFSSDEETNSHSFNQSNFILPDVIDSPAADVKSELIQRTPRFLGDVRSSHLSTPRRAKRYFNMAMNTIRKLRAEKKILQQKVKRRDKEILRMNDVIAEMKSNR